MSCFIYAFIIGEAGNKVKRKKVFPQKQKSKIIVNRIFFCIKA